MSYAKPDMPKVSHSPSNRIRGYLAPRGLNEQSLAKKLSQKGKGLIPTHPPTGSLASVGTSLRQAQGGLPRPLARGGRPKGLPGRDCEIV